MTTFYLGGEIAASAVQCLVNSHFSFWIAVWRFMRMDAHNKRIPNFRQCFNPIHRASDLILEISLGKYTERILTSHEKWIFIFPTFSNPLK